MTVAPTRLPVQPRSRGWAGALRWGEWSVLSHRLPRCSWWTRSTWLRSALLEKPYVPAIIGRMNDYKLQIVKAKGPFVWHKHDETDDFFLVIRGRLTIHLRDRDVVLDPGEVFVVPRGVEHCPDAEDRTEVCDRA